MTTVSDRVEPSVTHSGSIVDAFAAVVAQHGNRPALRSDGLEITYRELWDRSTVVAKIIRATAPPESPHVAVLIEQGIEAIAAILGVLRAGLAYVALDPMEPADRLRFICQDAEVKLILTSERQGSLARLIADEDQRVLNLARARRTARDRKSALASTVADPRLTIDEPLSPDARSCLVYTSGSTGQPKGVIRLHKNELSHSAAFADSVSLGAGDRLSLLFTLSFGAFNTDFNAALLTGATLCLYDVRRHGLDRLPEWAAKEELAILHTVPTVFRYLAENAPAEGFRSVRAINLAGEPVFRSDVRRSREAFSPNTIFINRYAATEIATIAQYVAGPADEIGDGPLPAGVAPAGVEILVVGDDESQVAPGKTGQIVVRSEFLSPGYWRRPDLTAASFADDPALPGLRRYRTGDAGQLDASGNLTVLGRRDTRVKIRGQSVELAEVEAALLSVPGVREAIIDVERDGSGPDAEVRLVGYVVAATDTQDLQPLDPQGLRRTMAERVPMHMIPTTLRVIEALPVTRTGKVDRQALRALPADTVSPSAEAFPVEPLQTDTERHVAAIFERVLGTPVTSRTDDFFALGGTSMTLAQLQRDVRNELGAELDLAELVRSAAVTDIAASVGRAAANAGTELVVPLRTEGAGAPLFLIHGWHGQAFVTPGLLDSVSSEHPVLSIRAHGIVDGARPLRSVAAMAREYLEAIDRFGHPQRPILVSICAGATIAHEMARQVSDAGRGQLPLIMLNPRYPFHARPMSTRLRDLTFFYLALGPVRRGPIGAKLNQLARSLNARAERLGPDVFDYEHANKDAAMRVGLSVGIALRRHRPGAFDGPAFVIIHERGVSSGSWGPDQWRKIVKGPIEVLGVHAQYKDALDPSNPSFQAAMRTAIAAIDDAAGTASASESPQSDQPEAVDRVTLRPLEAE